MQESFPLAVDWNDLTDEERYELAIQMEEAYEWEDARGMHDERIDEYEFAPDETWTEYLIEQEMFKLEAVSFYKKYLEYKGEKKPSPTLLSIFKYNTGLLNFFLNRIKDLKGNEIICEFQAIIELQREKQQKLVDDRRKLEPLRTELSDMGFVTKSKQNWSDGFGKKHSKKISRIIEEYRIYLERNRL